MRFETDYLDGIFAKVNMMELMEKHGVRVRAGIGKNNFYIADFCCGKQDFDNGRIKKETQTYRCEACHTGGNAIHFLREVVGRSFYEAVCELAEMTNTPLPEGTSGTAARDLVLDAEALRKEEALQLAADFFQEQNNYDYFLARGISLDILKKHKAGYAPGGRALRNYLHQKGFKKEELIKFNLIHPTNGLDRLFHRAIIPIYSKGKVVDFYGRATDDSKAGIKHMYLYGSIPFLGGYDHLENGKMVTIFESYIDQLVAETHGYHNSTNPGGAGKFGIDHIRLLKKKNPNRVVIVFDGDQAGRKGALDAGELLDKEGIDTHIGTLPEGEDPADILSKAGQKAFQQKVDVRKFEQVKMYSILSQYSMEDIEMYLQEMKGELVKPVRKEA
ncbi:toprim domain-containing protein [Paenibacillus taichungensis]|uniref:toprim domain-containing protein n=1 Tax=Paenibacillus taichungensis TaxID=484184 RepID=UPI0035DC18C0